LNHLTVPEANPIPFPDCGVGRTGSLLVCITSARVHAEPLSVCECAPDGAERL